MTIEEVLREMREVSRSLSETACEDCMNGCVEWSDAIEAEFERLTSAEQSHWRAAENMRKAWLKRGEEIERLKIKNEQMGRWQDPETAPLDTFVIVLWGSSSNDPIAVDFAKRRADDKAWITQEERIETEGYKVLGWLNLPEMLI